MLPNMAVHVVQRGNNRVVCFPSQNDYAYYVHQLRRCAMSHGCAVHAYCLMPNHVHLLVTPKQPDSCARMMKQLGQLHTQYINHRYGRTGTLWEGRFKSCLVQSEAYVLACYRYIELNPVRAALVRHPAEYSWSSFRANAEGEGDALVAPHPEYLALGKGADRFTHYKELFGSALALALTQEIREATTGGFALGSADFQSELARSLGRRVRRGKPGRPTQATPVDSAQLPLDF